MLGSAAIFGSHLFLGKSFGFFLFEVTQEYNRKKKHDSVELYTPVGHGRAEGNNFQIIHLKFRQIVRYQFPNYCLLAFLHTSQAQGRYAVILDRYLFLLFFKIHDLFGWKIESAGCVCDFGTNRF